MYLSACLSEPHQFLPWPPALRTHTAPLGGSSPWNLQVEEAQGPFRFTTSKSFLLRKLHPSPTLHRDKGKRPTHDPSLPSPRSQSWKQLFIMLGGGALPDEMSPPTSTSNDTFQQQASGSCSFKPTETIKVSVTRKTTQSEYFPPS